MTRKDSSANRPVRRYVRVPEDFKSALAKNSSARAAFEKFTYSHKKEWVAWIRQAKKSETRARRIEKAVSVLLKGK